MSRELLTGQGQAPDLFFAVGLVMWTAGGALAIYAWLWMVKGVEVIVIGPDVLKIRRDVFGFVEVRDVMLRSLSRAATTVQRLGDALPPPRSWSGWQSSCESYLLFSLPDTGRQSACSTDRRQGCWVVRLCSEVSGPR